MSRIERQNDGTSDLICQSSAAQRTQPVRYDLKLFPQLYGFMLDLADRVIEAAEAEMAKYELLNSAQDPPWNGEAHCVRA